MPASPRVAVGATLAAATLWGTSFLVNDEGLRSVGPATFVVLRFALAGTVVAAAALAMRRLRARFLRRPWFWGLVAANAAGFLLQSLAQTMTTPARTALFVNSSAFAVALLERVLHKHRLGWRRWAALGVGVAGASLLIVGGDLGALRGGRLLGDGLALASGLAWSVYFVMNRDRLAQEDPLSLTALTFAATGLVLLPALVLDDAPLAVPPHAWWTVLYAGLVTTALAYGLWAYGLRTLRATSSAVLLLVEILVASVLSLALGRDAFGPWEVAGAALLSGAVVAMSVLSAGDPAADHPV
ncbi:MAG TPA: DMT family transporter [Candidatus Thermoplasmatota archaeon]|nr:DMT family transporter [Candidatus Thermoplasmatota archaeon]